MDPMAEKYYSISPYVYVANNPMKFIDPTGMELKLTGEEAQAAFAEMQKAASQGLALSISEGGSISYTLNNDHALTDVDQDIINIIDDKSIKVNMLAEKGPFSSINGAIFAIGQFGGNVENKDENGNVISITATQVINPLHIKELDGNTEIPSQNMMHEMYEAYTGGRNALKYKDIGKPTDASYNGAYERAHKETSSKYRSTVTSRVFHDQYGNITFDMQKAVIAQWYYLNKEGKAKLLQEIKK